MVKINKVTTYVGDDGSTVLGDGTRLPKFHPRIAALGTLDEANAFIGLACHYVGDETRPILEKIQNDLFDLGADLCTPERPGGKAATVRFDEARCAWLDATAKSANRGLASLPSFILPNGTLAATHLHVARACVRRAERDIVQVCFQAPVTPAILRYVNRLSDLLFILARVENGHGAQDVLWRPGGVEEVAGD
ncbi:MAG: cob(I)yrinic acid a,c-diamide adenosyltransferase [Rhodoblastus sp.]|uniref:cob(I)yrinic acid a,c-diamide adenosyltransferase n=1 Tax=Rhodoblastus sp. TaxID=1962975 RepID=UPI003F9505EF